MISFGRSRAWSASATGRLICSSVNFEYVVDNIRKIRMTSSTSMNGIRLIAASSARCPLKLSAIRSAAARHGESHQVRHESIRRLLQLQRVAIDEAAEVAIEHERGDRDHEPECGVVERDRDAVREQRRVVAAGRR